MLLFLHGFLGQKEDWEPLIQLLPCDCCCIDLPYEESDIPLAIQKEFPQAKMVIGYSAGGRIALELKSRFPKSYGRIIALSAHPGLQNDEEKKARWKIDQEWISLLKTAPFEEFLEKWYDQELFRTLKKHPQFPIIFSRRAAQNPSHLAHFLERYSIAKKNAPEIDPRTIFISGKEDLKYVALYHRILPKLNFFTVENAGHAVHLENPVGCAEIIKGALDDHY
jgi:2-succinyl-6-hydroxy-2,4-cyclohexadiene-1-carboxylate synthase